MQKEEYLANPPWLVPKARMCDKSVTEKELSEEKVTLKFLGHYLIHLNHTKLSVVGIKFSSGVGCAVIHEDTA